MSLDPTLRISDTEREQAVAALGMHFSVDRLTMAELENRLDTAYAARTRTELDAVLADLPPTTRPSPPPPARHPFPGAAWAPWALTGAVCLLVWIATSAAQGQLHYFWPFWVSGPWGALLLAHTPIARSRPASRPTSSNASPTRENSARR